jgi:hypothetical protein
MNGGAVKEDKSPENEAKDWELWVNHIFFSLLRKIECGEVTFIKVVHDPLFAGDMPSPASEDISSLKIWCWIEWCEVSVRLTGF